MSNASQELSVTELNDLSDNIEVIPRGTAKVIEKVKMDPLDSIATGIDGSFAGISGGVVSTILVHLVTGIATFSTLGDSLSGIILPLVLSSAAGGFAVGAIVEKYSTVKKALTEIKTGYSFDGRLPVTNAFPGLKEKRLPLSLTSPTGETDEVILVSNRKGVWIESLDRKPSIAIWDEMMASIREVYKLPNCTSNRG